MALRQWSVRRIALIAGAWIFIVAALWQWSVRNPSYGMWEMIDADGDVLVRGQFSRPVLSRAVVLALVPPSILVVVWLARRRGRSSLT